MLAPIDQGVRNVGGRDGAAEGPERLLAGLDEAGWLPDDVEVRRVDAGNRRGTLEADLDRLSDAVEAVLTSERTPIVLGGDHGTSYATVRGAARVLDDPGVCYLDVHFDLRPFEPQHTSGSSFRRLIEEGHVAPGRVAPIGIEIPTTPEARKRSEYEMLEAYADAHGIPWVPLDEAKTKGPGALAETAMQTGAWCASLDTDAIDEALAPGVSAPGPGRFSLDQARGFLEVSLERASVLDVVEYAPRLDEGDRTLDTLVELLGPVLSGMAEA